MLLHCLSPRLRVSFTVWLLLLSGRELPNKEEIGGRKIRRIRK